ncbi:hypothetical protein OVA24_18335 [Luteolibacter sp. SL250]|uniref:hypothetical protein n=1 Tax=Luteolibacter sp. SL250 TaxID=2995170 RepID=UPI00226F89B3|nr:hypothetical protein [Luteolibacter sp. SL250]WAC19189.1 hypothetical protein OVA24_18335 [Luteolibacter sp. SL250]
MNGESNPYTPPAVEEPTAEPRDFPWYVAARGIFVQNGAVLPEVDLLTGEEGGHLHPVTHRVNLTKGKFPDLQTILMIAVIAGIVAADLPKHWMVISASGTAYLTNLIFRKKHPQVNFTFFSLSEAKRASAGKTILLVAEALLLLAGIGSLAFIEMEGWSWAGFIVCILCSHGVSKHRKEITTRGLEIREAGGAPGWVRIGDAHPAALAKLDEIQKHRGPLPPEFPPA